MYDTGLRVGKLIRVDVEFLRNDSSELYPSTEVQKDYPNEYSPPSVTLECSGDTTQLLSSYLVNRWKDTPTLFPSRSSDHIFEQGARSVIYKVVEEVGICSFRLDGSRGIPGDVTPHALRRGVAYRMMDKEERNSLYDVRNRPHHRNIWVIE